MAPKRMFSKFTKTIQAGFCFSQMENWKKNFKDWDSKLNP